MTNVYNFTSYFDNTNTYAFSLGCLSGSYLNTNYYNNISDKSKMQEFEYCVRDYTGSTKYTTNCQASDKRTGFFAMPAIGDFYAVPTSENYWTISVSKKTSVEGLWKDPYIMMMTTNGPEEKHVRTNGKLYPVIMLNNTVKIANGQGTSTSPYTLS